MHVETLSDSPKSWLGKEFVEREKSLLGMTFRVLGDVRASREDVTPSTKWRKAERIEKVCRKCSR